MVSCIVFVCSLLFSLCAQVVSNCYNKTDISIMQTADSRFGISGIANRLQCQKVCWYTTGCHSVVYDMVSTNCTSILEEYIDDQQYSQPEVSGSRCKNECEKRPCPFGYSCVSEGVSKNFNCFNLIGFAPPPGIPVTDCYVGLEGLGVYACLHGSPRKNKEDAETVCVEEAGHLIMLNSDQKIQALSTYIKSRNIPHASYVLVDGFDRYTNNTYFFWNGQEFNLTSAWNSGEPNSRWEQCLFLRDVGPKHTVYGGHCTTVRSFICERT